MDYQVDPNGNLYIETQIEGKSYLIEASEIHKERTGVHARLSIVYDDRPMAWDYTNTWKDADRVRLANSAHRHMDIKTYTKEDVKHDLDLFCLGLWQVYMELTEATEIEGDPDIKLSFLLRPYIVEGGGTILFAAPGRGKSYTGLAMAVCIDAGLNGLWPTRQAKTLFINLERSASSVKRRLGMVNRALGLPYNRKLLMLNQRGKSLADIYDSVKTTIVKHEVEFTVFDSLSRGGFGDLTGNQDVNRAVDGLNSLCKTWLALGHTPRNDETHVFGGVHFDAGADVMVTLSSEKRDDDTLGIALDISKANDVGPQPKQKIAFEFTNDALTKIRDAESWEFVKLDTQHEPDMEEQIEDYLLDVGKASAKEVAENVKFNKSNVSTALSHNPKFIMIEKRGRTPIYGVKTNVSP